jgi:hypothetical protein
LWEVCISGESGYDESMEVLEMPLPSLEKFWSKWWHNKLRKDISHDIGGFVISETGYEQHWSYSSSMTSEGRG